MNTSIRNLILLLIATAMWCTGCRDSAAGINRLRVATTTSTRDSGLLDELIPGFERQFNCEVDIIAVGTGAALAYGERGEVDVVIVHAPKAEEDFVRNAHGIEHVPFMQNEFIFVGPKDDPAELSNLELHDALNHIQMENIVFVSRGDDSGTHKRELQLWSESTVTPDHENYVETGQGMGNTLVIANQLQGYTFTDISTYLKFKQKLDLHPIKIDSQLLINRYSLITVNPEKTSKINGKLASALAEYLQQPETGEIIQNYQISGRRLFKPLFLDRADPVDETDH